MLSCPQVENFMAAVLHAVDPVGFNGCSAARACNAVARDAWRYSDKHGEWMRRRHASLPPAGQEGAAGSGPSTSAAAAGDSAMAAPRPSAAAAAAAVGASLAEQPLQQQQQARPATKRPDTAAESQVGAPCGPPAALGVPCTTTRLRPAAHATSNMCLTYIPCCSPRRPRTWAAAAAEAACCRALRRMPRGRRWRWSSRSSRPLPPSCRTCRRCDSNNGRLNAC